MIWAILGAFVLLIIMLIFLVTALVKRNKKAKIEAEQKINTTQEQLPFEYIRRGVVKLKNGQYIKLIQVPCINTQLMEEEEKEMVREVYAGVLNSLDFKIQFYKQSRLVDINDYLAFLKERENTADNAFKMKGLNEYSRFIRELIKENSVQTKRDFLVISFREDTQKNSTETNDNLKKYRKRDEDSKNTDEEEALIEEKMFEKAFKTLSQREKTLLKQLRRFGIIGKILNDKDSFELFYIAYNKERSVYQSLKGINPNNFTSLYVKQDKGGE
ncbi:hypothetical protein [Bacillus sp. Brlt_9]|uniref:hypothetical protein n=1 Tax=Bacillus sp. Brlt_9 TaxID=3110916 RepID=UPI003F7C39F6